MTKLLITKTVLRTILYQIVLVFIGISVGFIMNAKYWGNRAPLIQRSVEHIFYPIAYDENVKQFLFELGRSRIYFQLETSDPGFHGLQILEEQMVGEEYYAAKYKYIDINGEDIIVDDYLTHINWKPWELDYPLPDEE